MLYREIMAVYYQMHIKHINALCWQNVELLNFKLWYI